MPGALVGKSRRVDEDDLRESERRPERRLCQSDSWSERGAADETKSWCGFSGNDAEMLGRQLISQILEIRPAPARRPEPVA